jgi:hypothetical protein
MFVRGLASLQPPAARWVVSVPNANGRLVRQQFLRTALAYIQPDRRLHDLTLKRWGAEPREMLCENERVYPTPIQIGEQVDKAARRRLLLHHRDLELCRILLGVVDGVVRDDATRFVLVLPARVHVGIDAREVAARHASRIRWPASM